MRIAGFIGMVGMIGLSVCAQAQTVALGTGLMLPVGESRSITDRSQSLVLSFTAPTPLAFVAARADAGMFRARSQIVRGAVSSTWMLTMNGVARPPRLTSLYGMGGVGIYRSSLAPAPMRVKPTVDVGFNIGAGVDVGLGRVAGHAGSSSWLRRVGLFLESRLHHVMTEVSPTDFVDVTAGIRVRGRR